MVLNGCRLAAIPRKFAGSLCAGALKPNWCCAAAEKDSADGALHLVWLAVDAVLN